MKIKYLISSFIAATCMISCGSSAKLSTTHVAYQSVRSKKHITEVPDNASIAVGYTISPSGNLCVRIFNKTLDIITIDQQKSFFVNSDGSSNSYYDPTVRSTSRTNYESNTNSAAYNLGAIGGAFGIGGSLGTLLSGITVGEASTYGTSTTNSVITKDLPQISIAPRGSVVLTKSFRILGIGESALSNPTRMVEKDLTDKNSYSKFSVCISYSKDNGRTFKRIESEFYANSKIICPVKKHGKVNDALREIFETKTDALGEEWYLLYFASQLGGNNWNGAFWDYQ